MEKSFELQRAARENIQNLESYLTDLSSWEKEMKRKESALRGETEQELPPVRSKLKKERPIVKVPEKKSRIRGSDYSSWDKFDVDAACEQVDMSEVGPASLDSRRSEPVKLGKMREEAQYEKDRGNAFVKQEKWDEAVQCYNRAIELVKDDAIYYANRALCHLKQERLHQAESDCTEAIKLDSTYVKAFQRRAAAREKLGSLRAASSDLTTVLEFEPNNVAARKQLTALKERMATKGGKFKSSPATTPTTAPPVNVAPSPKIIEIPEEPPSIEEISTKVYSAEEKRSAGDNWPGGDGVNVIQPVQKPPHLRSQKPLRIVPIDEIQYGETEPILCRKDALYIDNGKSDVCPSDERMEMDCESSRDKKQNGSISPAESRELRADSARRDVLENLEPPATCVQFTTEWKTMRGDEAARRCYLNVISPWKIPSIFQNSLESDTLSSILATLASQPDMFKTGIKEYLRALTAVKRFSALAMFLSQSDKDAIKLLLQHCKESEGCSDEELNDLRNKFEL